MSPAPATPTTPQELLSYADSRHGVEQIELVLFGKPDSSGVPVEDRLTDLRDQYQHTEYRLVPARVLRGAAESLRAQRVAYGDLLQRLAEFQARTPVEFWPEDLQRAKRLIDQMGESRATGIVPPSTGE